MTSRLHFFGFEPGHVEADAFDVSACYETGHHYTYMSVRTEGMSVQYHIFFDYMMDLFSFQNNPKGLDLSYKTDLDLWNCLRRVKFVS